jgi:hypothetical protein
MTDRDTERINHIYAVYCKDESGIHLLKTAYNSKSIAYEYVVNKITTLLNIIDEEFKQNSQSHMLPIGAHVIYTLYKMKTGNHIEQYEYFKENHIKFFNYTDRKPIMFYVSTLELH